MIEGYRVVFHATLAVQSLGRAAHLLEKRKKKRRYPSTCKFLLGRYKDHVIMETKQPKRHLYIMQHRVYEKANKAILNLIKGKTSTKSCQENIK